MLRRTLDGPEVSQALSFLRTRQGLITLPHNRCGFIMLMRDTAVIALQPLGQHPTSIPHQGLVVMHLHPRVGPQLFLESTMHVDLGHRSSTNHGRIKAIVLSGKVGNPKENDNDMRTSPSSPPSPSAISRVTPSSSSHQ